MALRPRFHPYSATAVVPTSARSEPSASIIARTVLASGSGGSTLPSGSGSGMPTTLPSGSGSGMPPTGSGSGMPPTGSGSGMPPTLPTHPLSPALGHIIATLSSLRSSLDLLRIDLNKLKQDFEEFVVSNFSIECSVYKVCV